MTPRMKSKIRSLAAQINSGGVPVCVWIMDRGADLGHGPDYPARVPFRKQVGRYAPPCASGDIAEAVEHVLDEMSSGRSGKPARRGEPA